VKTINEGKEGEEKGQTKEQPREAYSQNKITCWHEK
jgi:hypothetical protein